MPGGAPGAPGPPMPVAASYPKKEAQKPGVQMKALHWGKIPDAKIKGTMWEKDVTDGAVKVNASELESLFAAKKAAAPKQKEGGEGGEGGAQHAALALALALALTPALALTLIPTLTLTIALALTRTLAVALALTRCAAPPRGV